MNTNHFQNITQNLAVNPASPREWNSLSHLPGVVLFTTDAEGHFTFLAGSGLEFLEIVPAEWLGRSIFEFLKNSSEYQAVIRRVFQGETYVGQSSFGTHHFEDRVWPIYDSDGKLLGISGIQFHVTENAKTQQALQKSEALLQNFLSSISDGIFVIDRDFTILRANLAMAEMYPEHLPLVGKKCYETSLLDRVCPNCPAEKMFQTGKPVTVEHYEQPVGDKPGMWLDHTAHPIVDKETDQVIGAVSLIRDVTQRKQNEVELQQYRTDLEKLIERRTQELQLTEARLQTILETSSAAISFCNGHGHLTYINKAYKELFGYSEDDLYNKLALVFSRGSKEDHQGFWDILQGKTDSNRVTTPMQKKDGQIVWADISANAVRGTDPSETQMISVIVDVTPQQCILRELQRTKEAAEEASRAKSQFLATMSHEIRTPLNGVIGISDLLMETPLQSKQLEYAKLIKASGESLLFLINDILDFSKIEAGKLNLEESEFVVHDLIESVLGILASKADERQLELVATFDSLVPGPIIGDSGRLRQILVNLIGNALKFTEKGGVRIHTVLDEILEDRIRLKFSVADTGIGIAKDQQDRLFERFEQVDASTTRIYGGTGLGLAISKKLVELMDGTINVESTEGKGTTFYFTAQFQCLPLVLRCMKAAVHPCITEKRDYCRGIPPQRCARSGREVAYLQRVAELKGLKVLLFGTGIVKIPAITEQLQSWRMQVQAVASPAEVLQCLNDHRENPFQLLIVDFLSNDFEAESLVRKIQDHEQYRAIPVVFLSPLSEDLLRKSWQIPEKIRCITKPVCSSALLDSVVRSLFVLPDLVTADSPAETPLVSRSIRVLVAEDNQINRIVISEILKNAGMEFAVVENGELAVETVKKASAPFHIVLMDCQMPLVDGYEATERIRQWEKETLRSSRLPIIALTANATSEDEGKCLAAGMDAYCSKPIDASKLLGLIRQSLEYPIS